MAGNLASDSAAKASLLLPMSHLTVPHSDYSSLIRIHVLNQWQQTWDAQTQNKLHAIESKSMEEELMLNRKKLNELQLICLRCADSVDLWTGKLQNDLTAGYINTNTVKDAVCGLKEASFKLKMATSSSSFFHLVGQAESSDPVLQQPSEEPSKEPAS